jgi:hypothetical protein
MKRSRQRKCRHCRALFRPDVRNLRHQRYCAGDACRKASKAASQRRWLSKSENRDYFRGPANVQRVREWRTAHPSYWRRYKHPKRAALQEHSLAQPSDEDKKTGVLVNSALQDLLAAESTVLLGLIANLMGSVQQDEIALTGQRLQQLGHDILTGSANAEGAEDAKTRVEPRPAAPAPGAVQLGGPTPGS